MPINLNSTTPAAPSNSQNVNWQIDGSGNVSANVPLPGVPFLTALINPPISGWTGIDMASPCSFDTTYGPLYVHAVADSTSSDHSRAIYRSSPIVPFTLTMGFTADFSGYLTGINDANGPNNGFGIYLGDGSGKQISFRWCNGNGTSQYLLSLDGWSSETSYGTTRLQAHSSKTPAGGAFYYVWFMRVQDDGTNLTFSTSIDGNHWIPFNVWSRTAYLTSGPTQIGLHAGTYNSGNGVEALCVHWNVTTP